MIRQRCGQRTRYANLARAISASVRHWIGILESLYFCYAIRPWHVNVTRSRRKEPILWDWSQASARRIWWPARSSKRGDGNFAVLSARQATCRRPRWTALVPNRSQALRPGRPFTGPACIPTPDRGRSGLGPTPCRARQFCPLPPLSSRRSPSSRNGFDAAVYWLPQANGRYA